MHSAWIRWIGYTATIGRMCRIIGAREVDTRRTSASGVEFKTTLIHRTNQ
jgi:hypothetical protein